MITRLDRSVGRLLDSLREQGLEGDTIVFFTSGLHDDYHRPDDEPAKIDYAKLAAVTRLMLEVGRAVADSPQRPR